MCLGTSCQGCVVRRGEWPGKRTRGNCTTTTRRTTRLDIFSRVQGDGWRRVCAGWGWDINQANRIARLSDSSVHFGLGFGAVWHTVLSREAPSTPSSTPIGEPISTKWLQKEDQSANTAWGISRAGTGFRRHLWRLILLALGRDLARSPPGSSPRLNSVHLRAGKITQSPLAEDDNSASPFFFAAPKELPCHVPASYRRPLSPSPASAIEEGGSFGGKCHTLTEKLTR